MTTIAPPKELVKYYEGLVHHTVNSIMSCVPAMFRPKRPPLDMAELARMFAYGHVLHEEIKNREI